MKRRREAMKKSRRGLIVFSSLMLSPAARAVRELVAKMPPLPIPPTVKECAAQGLLPCGFTPSRTAMSPAHTLKLLSRYPYLYSHADDKPVSSSEPFASEGFACGDGWFTIIDRLSAKLAADPNLVVGQLKQKQGLLRIYFDVGEPASPKIEAMTDAALRKACGESRRICEVCGVQGSYKTLGPRVGVLCEPDAWLIDGEEACQRLTEIAKGRASAKRARREILLDAAKLHIRRLGEVARHQSPRRRAKFPGVDWELLDTFRAMTGITGAPAMTEAQIYRFVQDEVPTIAKALR